MNSPSSPPDPGDDLQPAVLGRKVVSPLLPTMVTLIVAAALLGGAFAWWFPAAPGKAAPPARFTDITAAAGLRFQRNAGLDVAGSPTTLAGGVVFFDYNRDGRPDLFFVNGAPWPWEESLAKRAGGLWPALYRNDGDGHFTDVTAAAGLNVELQGVTAVAGDYDNDGYPDLFVTCVGSNHLFRNRGNGRFEDVTESAGVGGEDNTWSTGAAWLDYDNDGWLDLVVAHYARWPREVGLGTAFGVAAMGHSYGTPTGFVGAPPSLYRNLGDGRFVLVPGSRGLQTADPQTGRPRAQALAVVPLDANGDGKLDLLFTFHTGEDVLFLNRGDGTFRPLASAAEARREGVSAGYASTSPLPFTQMAGVAERFLLLRAAATLDGGGPENFLPLDRKGEVALLDYDNDGRIDIFAAEGRAEPDLNRFEEGREFAAAPTMYWNRGDGWAVAPVSRGAGLPALVARGIATADIDGDGDLDVVIATAGDRPLLLRNDRPAGQPWLAIDLVATHSQRDAGGARVEVYTPRHVWVQTMAPAIGYMAQSESTLHFGLGDDARVRRIVVLWPSGTHQEIRAPGLNRRLTITEP